MFEKHGFTIDSYHESKHEEPAQPQESPENLPIYDQPIRRYSAGDTKVSRKTYSIVIESDSHILPIR
jgi:hypothetical protein